jgi:hypothetical protein
MHADPIDWLERSIRKGDERAEWLERNPLLAVARQEPQISLRRATSARPARKRDRSQQPWRWPTPTGS